MPEYGYVAFCIRPDCEWVAMLENEAGESTDCAVFTQLGALAAIDAHLRDEHGAKRGLATFDADVEAKVATAA